jgi:hypothetical protein
MEIILINTGVFQKYIHANIRNLKAFENYNITVITDKSLSNNFTDVNVFYTEDLDLFDFDKYDAVCGDAVLQVAVLGEVVYG